MSDPNVLGYVTEYVQDKNDFGLTHARIRLDLRNTLGQTKTIWVDAPSDLAAFYSPEGELECR
jgi:hypothetical protein